MKKTNLGWFAAIMMGIGWFVSENDDKKSHLQTSPAQQISLPSPVTTPVPDPAKPTSPSVIKLPEAEKPPPSIELWVYTKAKSNIRKEPSTKSAVVVGVPAGERLLATSSRNNWYQVAYGSAVGWIRQDLVSEQPPLVKRVEPKVPLVAAPKARVVSRSGEPSRSPYVGTCDCPYDRMRNGNRCGARSAYSRPGGRNPVCYFD